MSSVVKISQLNTYTPGNPLPVDFFPLVNSASMTTYQVTVAQLNNALTFPQYVSGSKIASSSLFSSGSNFASSSNSASFASSSNSASHALFSDNAGLGGNIDYFPYWTGNTSGGSNGNLYNGQGPLQVNFNSAYPGAAVGLDYPGQNNTFNSGSQNYSIYGKTYSFNQYYNPKTLVPKGYNSQADGYISFWPVIAPFIGSDHIVYSVATSSANFEGEPFTNQIWSGSWASGSYYTLSSTPPNTISGTFNGSWVRIVAMDLNQIVAPNSAKSKKTSGAGNFTSGLYGNIKLNVGTSNNPGASNVGTVIDFDLYSNGYEMDTLVKVNCADLYNYDIIKAIRISKSIISGSYNTAVDVDPSIAVDLYLNGFTSADPFFQLECWAQGNIRFLNEPTLNPPPLVNTYRVLGQNDPTGSSYVIFPPEPGIYSNEGIDGGFGIVKPYSKRNYNIHGQNVTICPDRNLITGSARDNSIYNNPYALNIYGNVNSLGGYYFSGSQGKTSTSIQYDSASAKWVNYQYQGGILTNTSSVSNNPGKILSSSLFSIRTSSPYTTSFAHGLPNTPSYVKWVLVCTGSVATFNIGDEISVDGINTGNSTFSFGTHGANASNIFIYYNSNSSFYYWNTAGVFILGNAANGWKLKCYYNS